jgi:hypothetical protein
MDADVDNENDTIEQVMETIDRSEALARGLGGALTRLGTMLSVASRHVAIQSRVVEAELRMIDSKARVGGAEWDAISVFGTFSTNAIEAVRSASDELAVKRALVFRQIMSLLSIGRDRLEVRDYLAERGWERRNETSSEELVAQELILSTPGMVAFIRGQVEIDELWIEPAPSPKRRRSPGRRKSRKASGERD